MNDKEELRQSREDLLRIRMQTDKTNALLIKTNEILTEIKELLIKNE